MVYMQIKIHQATSDDIEKYVEQLGQLRIEVFKEWPYLYEGDLNYEREYLKSYVTAKDAVCFLLRQDQEVIGASTAIAMSEADKAFAAPLKNLGYPLEKVMYFGESIIQKDYRGGGWGAKFFASREEFARQKGYSYCVFCSVERPDDHPLRPAGYRPLNQFWQRLGYREHPDAKVEFRWKSIGDQQQSVHRLTLWSKKLDPK